MTVEKSKVKSHAQVRRKRHNRVQGQPSKARSAGQKIAHDENARYNERYPDVVADTPIFTRNALSVSAGITKCATRLVYVSNQAASACWGGPLDQTPGRSDTWRYTVCCPFILHSHNVIFDPHHMCGAYGTHIKYYKIVDRAGFEPTTPRVQGGYTTSLYYRPT